LTFYELFGGIQSSGLQVWSIFKLWTSKFVLVAVVMVEYWQWLGVAQTKALCLLLRWVGRSTQSLGLLCGNWVKKSAI